MNSTKLNRVVIIICILMMTVSFGCQNRKDTDYKQRTDDEVYGIINDKWESQFGEKANYKTSDSTDEEVIKFEPGTGPLRLADALAVATAQNRQYQTEKETMYNTVLDLTLVRHEFKPNLFAGGGFGYSDEEDDSMVGGRFGVGLSQLLADGTRITTDVGLAWADVLTGNARSGFGSIFSAVVTKPLLRGSSRKFVLES
ncbi:MAG: hypothetical protein KAS23_15280, partial [Anaerohalosphaera sp.]|nr:hypothetical protein [Anaerohalosphaera sp.]